MIAQTLSVGGHKYSEVACLFFKNKNTTQQHSNGKWTRPVEIIGTSIGLNGLQVIPGRVGDMVWHALLLLRPID